MFFTSLSSLLKASSDIGVASREIGAEYLTQRTGLPTGKPITSIPPSAVETNLTASPSQLKNLGSDKFINVSPF